MRRPWASALLLLVLATGCGTTPPHSAATTAPTFSPPFSPPSPSPTPRIHVPPIPDGVYETTVTRSDARRFGVFRCDPEDVDENTGHIRLSLQAGRLRWDIRANHPIFNPTFTGVYTGNRTRVTLLFDPNTADVGADTLQWSFDGKQLHFKVLRSLPDTPEHRHLCVSRMQYEAHPWEKTG
jgi:hypothetical protein